MPSLKPFLDRLHATPPGDFVRVRKELAAELRSRGDAEGAATLAAVKKPPVTAWALNQVALAEPAAVTAVAHATSKLAAAQQRALAGSGGGAEAFREASRALHARIAEVVGKARATLRAAGKAPSVAQLRRIQRSLQALPFAAPDDVERLSRGHLEADLDAPAAFDLFGSGSSAGSGSGEAAAAPRTRPTRGSDRATAEHAHAHAKKRARADDHERERRERDAERARTRAQAHADALARRHAREEREAAEKRDRDEARRTRERERARKHQEALERRARDLEKRAASLAKAASAAAAKAQEARRRADAAARGT